jgi:hypothetical protein
MRWPEPGRARLWRRRRRLALLAGVASLLGMGLNPPARAQDAGAPQTGEALFGTYQLDARGSGVEARYELVGLLPGGSPVLDLTLPETVARFGSGPTGYGLASLAYPGALIGNFGSLVSQAGGPGDQIPPYPIKAEAFFPSGPVESDTSQGPAVQKVVTGELGVQVDASFPAIEAAPVVTVDTLRSASRSAIEGELAVSRTRVVLSGVSILGGLITIDSVVTDLVAAHDGTSGSTNGGTTATGVKLLGLSATLTEDGLVLAEAPPVSGPAAPLGGLLDDLVGPLDQLTEPVQDLLAQVLDQAVPQLDDVLGQAGIHLRILDPQEQQVESGAATRISAGLELSLSFEGKEQPALVELINSIPADLKPNLGPIPNPVTFLAENHIVGLSLAPATVSALATPPFPAMDAGLPSDLGPADLPLGPGASLDLGSPGFSTPTAPLPALAGTIGPSGGPATEPVSAALDGAVPAILVALALLASPLFGLGSSRLADNVLAPISTSCPTGLDQPPAPPRTS